MFEQTRERKREEVKETMGKERKNKVKEKK